MPDSVLKEIADSADLIVAGYSYTMEGDKVRILNLERPEFAAALDKNGDMIETTMDDMELSLVQSYYLKNIEFLGE